MTAVHRRRAVAIRFFLTDLRIGLESLMVINKPCHSLHVSPPFALDSLRSFRSCRALNGSYTSLSLSSHYLVKTSALDAPGDLRCYVKTTQCL